MTFKHDMNLEGVYVVLRPDVVKEGYRSPEWLVVKVIGGFGARPGALGRTVYFRFHDGDVLAGGIGWIDRYGNAREIHRFAHLADDTTCVMGDECPSLEPE